MEAIARNEAGEVIAKDRRKTAGKAAGVRLLKKNTRLQRTARRPGPILPYEIVDEEGRVVPTANNLHFHLHGQGQIVGVDNGNKLAVNATKRRKMAHGTGL